MPSFIASVSRVRKEMKEKRNQENRCILFLFARGSFVFALVFFFIEYTIPIDGIGSFTIAWIFVFLASLFLFFWNLVIKGSFLQRVRFRFIFKEKASKNHLSEDTFSNTIKGNAKNAVLKVLNRQKRNIAGLYKREQNLQKTDNVTSSIVNKFDYLQKKKKFEEKKFRCFISLAEQFVILTRDERRIVPKK